MNDQELRRWLDSKISNDNHNPSYLKGGPGSGPRAGNQNARKTPSEHIATIQAAIAALIHANALHMASSARYHEALTKLANELSELTALQPDDPN